MSFSRLESSLSEIARDFDEVVRRRERLIKDTRVVIASCGKAIVCIHASNFSEAIELGDDSKARLTALRRVASSDLRKYLLPAEQEFVEFSTLLSLRIGRKIPSRKQLMVGQLSYILGLLDVIGELKRSVFDAIREDKFSTAQELFADMERLHLILSPFALYENVAQGVRHKIDVSRMLIEDSRATITEEVRRRVFIIAINKLSNNLEDRS